MCLVQRSTDANLCCCCNFTNLSPEKKLKQTIYFHNQFNLKAEDAKDPTILEPAKVVEYSLPCGFPCCRVSEVDGNKQGKLLTLAIDHRGVTYLCISLIEG